MFTASGVCVMALDDIRQEIYERAPGAYLFPHATCLLPATLAETQFAFTLRQAV
jgi:hypothetical protein